MTSFDNVSLNGANEASKTFAILSKQLSNMASGLRINSAVDDASGLAVRELLRADIVTARQGSRNVQDGISMLQTAESSAGAAGKILIYMKELVMQILNGTYSDQHKNIIQQELQQLSEEIARIFDSTTYNGTRLYQDGQSVSIAFGDGDMISINTKGISVVSVDLINDAVEAAEMVNSAMDHLTAYRGSLGASMNRLASIASVLDIEAENLLAAESQISDLDMALSVTSMTASELVARTGLAARAQMKDISSQISLMLIGG